MGRVWLNGWCKVGYIHAIIGRWLGMKSDVADFVSKSQTCLQINLNTNSQVGCWSLLTSLLESGSVWHVTLLWKLPKTLKKHDSIWVVVDRLTKSAHFFPTKSTQTIEYLARLYIDKNMRLHGVQKETVSDQDSLFTLHSWCTFQKVLGTEIKLSNAYHPQTDSQSEPTIQVLEDLLRACILAFWIGEFGETLAFGRNRRVIHIRQVLTWHPLRHYMGDL